MYILSAQNKSGEVFCLVFLFIHSLIHSFIHNTRWNIQTRNPFYSYSQSTPERTLCPWHIAVYLEHDKCSVHTVQDLDAKDRQSKDIFLP